MGMLENDFHAVFRWCGWALMLGVVPGCVPAHDPAIPLKIVLDYQNFKDAAHLVLNDAARVEAYTHELGLTWDSSQVGAVFADQRVDVRAFNLHFGFDITGSGARGPVSGCNDQSGGNGLVFVLQNVGSDVKKFLVKGKVNSGIGYQKIPKSFGIEFDTWCDVENNDPDSNHVALVVDGHSKHQDLPVVHLDESLDNGQIWDVWIDYDGQWLEVRMTHGFNRPQHPVLRQSLDIPQLVGEDHAFVGFTASTNFFNYANHRVMFWEYQEGWSPQGITLRGPRAFVSMGIDQHVLKIYESKATKIAINPDEDRHQQKIRAEFLDISGKIMESQVLTDPRTVKVLEWFDRRGKMHGSKQLRTRDGLLDLNVPYTRGTILLREMDGAEIGRIGFDPPPLLEEAKKP